MRFEETLKYTTRYRCKEVDIVLFIRTKKKSIKTIIFNQKIIFFVYFLKNMLCFTKCTDINT
jgi:hypothetical protein